MHPAKYISGEERSPIKPLEFSENDVENTFGCTKNLSAIVTSTPNKNLVFGTHQTSGFIIKKDNLCYLAVPPSSAIVDSKPIKKDLSPQVPVHQYQTPSFLIKKGNLCFHATPPLHQTADWSLKPDVVPSSLRKVEKKIPTSTLSSVPEQCLAVRFNTHSSSNLSLRESLDLQQKLERKIFSNKKLYLCRPSSPQIFNHYFTMYDKQKTTGETSGSGKHLNESSLRTYKTSVKKSNKNHHKPYHNNYDSYIPSNKSSLVYSSNNSSKSKLEMNSEPSINCYSSRNAIDSEKCKNDSLSNTVDQDGKNSSSVPFKEMEIKQKMYLESLKEKMINSFKTNSSDNEEHSKKRSSFSKSKSSSTTENEENSIRKIKFGHHDRKKEKHFVSENSKNMQKENKSRESAQILNGNTGRNLETSKNSNDSRKREKKKNLDYSLLNASKVEKEIPKTLKKEADSIKKPVKAENKNKKIEKTRSILSKESFYGDKGKHSVTKKSKKKHIEDPVVLTLSSDDEDESGGNTEATEKTASSNEISSNFKFDDKNYDEELFSVNSKEDFVALKCKSVFIGSYRVIPKSKLKITKGCFTMVVPPVPKDKMPVKLLMSHKGILKVVVNFEDEYPVIFLYIKPSMAIYIVNELKMSSESGPYIDPLNKDERKTRITFITEKVNQEFISSIREFWNIIPSPSKSLPLPLGPMLIEISSEEVSDILEKVIPPPQLQEKEEISSRDHESKKLFVYPPPPHNGGITITTSDYCCLEEEQFVNDVIIDFYLTYLMDNEIEKKNREKVHIFSTFFYNRLTTRPKNPKVLLEEETMSPAERRHSRVQSWTKNIDVFSKDFILVPINEHSHWFLAVICFPGLNGPMRLTSEGKLFPVLDSPTCSGKTTIKLQKKRSECPNMSDPECSDRDEAESDEGEELHENGAEELSTHLKRSKITKESSHQKSENKDPIIQPCILIFDSLPGSSPSRIVATLRNYLSVEYEKKKGHKKAFDKETMKGACPKVAHQNNFSDCGLYTLQYAESFFKHPLKDFRFPIRSLRDWFREDVIQHKRQYIANLIKNLTLSSNPNKEIKLPKLSFAGDNVNKREKRREKLSEVRKRKESNYFEGRCETLSKVPKYETVRTNCDSKSDKNIFTSSFGETFKYPNDCSPSATVKKNGVDEEVGQEAKKLKLDTNIGDTFPNPNIIPTYSPTTCSDDNDSGHHSDTDDSKEYLNKGFYESDTSPKDASLDIEDKLKNILETDDIYSKTNLVSKNNLKSDDLCGKIELATQQDSLSLIPKDKKLYGRSYENTKKSKLSLAYKKETFDSVPNTITQTRNLNYR